jgi:hypothetical protein
VSGNRQGIVRAAPVWGARGENDASADAAFRATLVYPGPVGELLCRELLDWEEFGYRFGGGAFLRG